MVEAVDIPVTAKMRLGWDQGSINASELSRALEDAGCAMVTVHGRTRAQRYVGRADWGEIARVREAVRIPVVGSGDVTDVREIRRRLLEGEVDGVVIARGALGNLWFIRQAAHHVATGELLPDLGFTERIELTRRHLELLIEHYGEARALVVGRKYVAWTIKGCNGAARLRAMVQNLVTRADLDAILGQALVAGLARWLVPADLHQRRRLIDGCRCMVRTRGACMRGGARRGEASAALPGRRGAASPCEKRGVPTQD